MAHSEKNETWRGHLGWLAGQLIVIFAGVTAAFVVENYRDNQNQQAEFRQALSGLIAELNRYETPGPRVGGCHGGEDIGMGEGGPKRDASYPRLL